MCLKRRGERERKMFNDDTDEKKIEPEKLAACQKPEQLSDLKLMSRNTTENKRAA